MTKDYNNDKRVKTLQDVIEYIVQRNESSDSCIDMELAKRVLRLKTELAEGDLVERYPGEIAWK